jgi:hypothetical protein
MAAKVLTCFKRYLELEGTPIHRAAAEPQALALAGKQLLSQKLRTDCEGLIPILGCAFNQRPECKAHNSFLPTRPFNLSFQIIKMNT